MSTLASKASKTKRRVSQTIREKLKRASITEDAVWDATFHDFCEVENALHILGENLHAFSASLAMWTDASANMARQMELFIATSPADSQLMASAKGFKDSCASVDEDIRRHVTKVYVEKVMEPLRIMCAQRIPELKAEAKRRNGLRKDLDAFRYNLQKAENKKERDEAKITALKEKLAAVQSDFKECDAHVKKEMRWIIDHRHTIVEPQMIATAACFHDFYTRAASKMELAVNSIPESSKAGVSHALSEGHKSGRMSQEDLDNMMSQRGTWDRVADAAEAATQVAGKAIVAPFIKHNGQSDPTSSGGGSASPPPPLILAQVLHSPSSWILMRKRAMARTTTMRYPRPLLCLRHLGLQACVHRQSEKKLLRYRLRLRPT